MKDMVNNFFLFIPQKHQDILIIKYQYFYFVVLYFAEKISNGLNSNC